MCPCQPNRIAGAAVSQAAAGVGFINTQPSVNWWLIAAAAGLAAIAFGPKSEPVVVKVASARRRAAGKGRK